MKKHSKYEAWPVVGLIIFTLVLMIVIHGILSANLPTFHRYEKGRGDSQSTSITK